MYYDIIGGGTDNFDDPQQQICLGVLIDKLSEFGDHYIVKFVGTDYSPTGTSSYRGYYDDLAINYADEDKTVGEVLIILKSAVNQKYFGYKGGEYIMRRYTRVWAAEDSSHCSSLGIVSVFMREGTVQLGTVLKD